MFFQLSLYVSFFSKKEEFEMKLIEFKDELCNCGKEYNVHPLHPNKKQENSSCGKFSDYCSRVKLQTFCKVLVLFIIRLLLFFNNISKL
jgi:hypothetical protein